jgi:CheY-like chemotaxis protein
MLEVTLAKWGYDVLVARDGPQAWQVLDGEEPPSLALLDWVMPGMDGLEVCRKVRSVTRTPPIYIILLTARVAKDDVIRGFDAGADDYVTKPFNSDELRARVKVGRRIVELQKNLALRVQELENALARVKKLQGLLPICSYCKRIRDDQNYWQQVESYFSEHSDAEFTHGICPDCYDKVVKRKFSQLAASGEMEK